MSKSAVVYPPVAKFQFRAGPYVPPAVKAGSVIHDLYYGDVKVAGTTKAQVRWPGCEVARGRHKGLMPIFFDGLVRAVVEEDEVVVAHYWGVNRYMVLQWKRALVDGKDMTTNEVFTALALKRADPEFRRQYGFK
jgi:hypothetical protein